MTKAQKSFQQQVENLIRAEVERRVIKALTNMFGDAPPPTGRRASK